MKFGIMQGTLAQPTETVFKVAAELGFDGIELHLSDDFAADPLFFEDGRAETKTMAQAAGVETPSLCLGTLNRGGLANDDPSLQLKARELILRSVDVAAHLGASVILVPFFFEAAIKDEAAMKRVIAGFKHCLPPAEEKGIVLAYEGDLPAGEILRLIHDVGSPAIKCYYDVGNAVWLGHDPVMDLKQLGVENIAQIHVKDIKGEGVQSLNDVMLGEGRLPLSQVAKTIKDLGYDGYLVLETRNHPDPVECARQNLQTLKRAMS